MRRGTKNGLVRGPVQLAAAGLAVMALTAACGSVAGPLLVGAPRLADHRGGPPWNDRAGALAIARQLLAQAVVPGGTQWLPHSPIPSGLHQPGIAMAARMYLDRYRLYRLPMSMDAAARFLRAHPPAGLTLQGTGSSGNRSGITQRDLSFAPKREPFGISALALVETVIADAHGHALMRADAEVIWFPRRSAAEHLNAADFRAVRVAAVIYRTGQRTIARTFTSPGTIGRLIQLLNSLPASPGGVVSCPASFVTVRATFTPTAGHASAVASSSGCASDSIMVGGKEQPALNDLGRLQALIERMLHLRAFQRMPVAHG